jgi:hypothetical protein
MGGGGIQWRRHFIWSSFVCAFAHACCCKCILEFSTLYFMYFAPSAHLIQSWNLLQTSYFNTAHFRIQYRTLSIQYCTKCAILHTKIGPGRKFSLGCSILTDRIRQQTLVIIFTDYVTNLHKLGVSLPPPQRIYPFYFYGTVENLSRSWK